MLHVHMVQECWVFRDSLAREVINTLFPTKSFQIFHLYVVDIGSLPPEVFSNVQKVITS